MMYFGGIYIPINKIYLHEHIVKAKGASGTENTALKKKTRETVNIYKS